MNGRNRSPTEHSRSRPGATLQVYNWADYLYKGTLADFEEKFDVKLELTTFNNMEEGIQKLAAGQVQPDVFFPTTDYISRLAANRR